MLPALPRAVTQLLKIIQDSGGQGWVVGGALRDMLMEKLPSDWDIATTLTPEELLGIFPYARLIGGHCGTVEVRWNNYAFEITPCRAEEGYSDGRHPDKVEFVPNILTDLARRDFTINAMAYNGQILLDPFGGQRDIQNRLIRCVGKPARRFEEDKLRILRMLRFSASLGFSVEKHTRRAAMAAMPGVNTLSRERVRGEVHRILLGRRPQVLSGLIASGGLSRYGFRFAPSMQMLQEVPDQPLYRWWALAALCGVEARCMGESFGFSRRFIGELTEMSDLYRRGPAHDEIQLKTKLRGADLDYKPVSETFAALSPAFAGEPGIYAGILLRNEPFRVRDLAVTGMDLQGEGIDGPACGTMLDSLLGVVIREPGLNRRDVLLGIARGLNEMME